MKRTVSISLIILTLLVSIQPVLYFHYCKGELNSVSVQSPQTNSCCSEMPSQGINKSNCCNDLSVIISVENYEAKQVQFDLNLLSAFVKVQQQFPIFSGLNSSLKESCVSPFGTLIRSCLERLVFICTYRI